MKNKPTLVSAFSILFTLIITSIFSLSSCDKEKTSNCKDKNLTCSVSGSSFQSCVITVAPASTYTWIQAQQEDGKGSIHLYLPKDTGTYALGGVSGYSGQYWEGSILKITSYTTDTSHTGTVSISKYDAANKVMSGAFNFDAKQLQPAGTGTKSVTSGSFTYVKW